MKQILQDLTTLFNKQDYLIRILKQYHEDPSQLRKQENLLCVYTEKTIEKRYEDLHKFDYVCPITRELLLEPAIIVHEDDSISSEYNQYFEYQIALNFIQINKINPLTRQPAQEIIRGEHKQREIIKTLSEYTLEYIQ